MKIVIFGLAATMLAAGCGDSNQAIVDNLVRQAVSNSGAPDNIAMAEHGDGSFRGTASVRQASGSSLSFNCTVTPQGDSAGYQARCVRAIDQGKIDALEGEIRQRLIAVGNDVVAVELTRESDDRMTGYAEQRIGDRTVRAPCEATRENPNSSAFTWECRPAPGTPPPGGNAQ